MLNKKAFGLAASITWTIVFFVKHIFMFIFRMSGGMGGMGGMMNRGLGMGFGRNMMGVNGAAVSCGLMAIPALLVGLIIGFVLAYGIGWLFAHLYNKLD